MKSFSDTLYSMLGERIKKRREEVGLRQEALAKKINMSRTSISNIESGKHQIPLSKLYLLSNVLKYEIHFLLPTYEDINEYMDDFESSDIKTILTQKDLDKKEREDLEDLLKNLE